MTTEAHTPTFCRTEPCDKQVTRFRLALPRLPRFTSDTTEENLAGFSVEYRNAQTKQIAERRGVLINMMAVRR